MDYTGKIISKNPPQPTQASASGVWTLDEAAAAVKNNSWPIPGVPNPVSRSLRFNSADSAYLNRTPAGAGNRTTFTWSSWVKRCATGADQQFMAQYTDASNRSYFDFRSVDTFLIFNRVGGVTTCQLETTQVFRDVSSWYHVVLAVDTTQATNTNRVKLYINGSQVTAFGTSTYPSQNDQFMFNSTNVHRIGSYDGTTDYFNGYMTEINFIDGQALTPSSFGQTNANTGVWEPKPYTGTYGGNGFYLNFKDSATTTALGYDYSGNANNWTPNNFSVTAGAGNDSLTDVPTQWIGYNTSGDTGGIWRGNYCTLNPLSNTAGTYTQGNLRFTGPNGWRRSNGTLAVSTGKWYWEVTISGAPYTPRANNTNYQAFGFGLSTSFGSQTDPVTQTDAVVYCDNGYYKNFSGANTDGGTAIALNDVLSIAVDLDANTFTFRLNNTQIATGTIGGTAGRELVPIIVSYANQYGVMDCNFGQRPFAYAPPAGFLSLCTTNLPTPTIGATSTTQAGDYFNTVLYTGNSTIRSITGVGFQPDFVWIKDRSNGYSHRLADAVRGAGKELYSDGTNAETTNSANGYVSSFDSDGFGLQTGIGVNNTGVTYVAWNWKANGAGSSNTAGSISSTVSANTAAGFSVVTYTGNGTASTVGHGCLVNGVATAPSMIIVKNRSDTWNWRVYHVSLGNTKWIALNTTAAAVTETVWNNTTPTSTVFSISSDGGVNTNGNSMVAYCFAPVASYSSFGSYVGNGSSDGTFVYTGFKPAWVMVKGYTGTNAGSVNWWIFDGKRPGYNVTSNRLAPNVSDAEYSNGTIVDFTSNGFKWRDSSGGWNDSAITYIYAAFAEFPFKYTLAR